MLKYSNTPPDRWIETRLFEICSMQSGVGITSLLIDEHSKYPCYGGNGIRGYTRKYTHDGTYALIGRQGALCGNVNAASGKFFASEHAIVVTTKNNIDIKWLTHVLREGNLNQYSESSAQPGLSVSKILTLSIIVPPLEEQRAIAQALSDVDDLLAKLDQLIAKKSDIKKGAMQELLTGKRRLPGFSEGWREKMFGELFSFSGGYSASRADLSHKGLCYLHYGDIHLSEKTYIDLASEQADIPKLDIAPNKISRASLLEDGDVVFVDASEDDEGVSKHVVINNPEGRPFVSGLHTIVAKSKTVELDNRFKRFCFQTVAVKEQFKFFAVGTKVSGISKTNVAKIWLRFPSIEEQSAIATVLSDMEAEISELKSKRTKLATIKQGMMQQLLTGKIRLV